MIRSNREREQARFILTTAAEAGIRVGTDGYWIDPIYPKGTPREVRAKFDRAFGKLHDAIVALIIEEGGR